MTEAQLDELERLHAEPERIENERQALLERAFEKPGNINGELLEQSNEKIWERGQAEHTLGVAAAAALPELIALARQVPGLKTALESAEETAVRLTVKLTYAVRALKFYADRDNWDNEAIGETPVPETSSVAYDGGTRARKALKVASSGAQ